MGSKGEGRTKSMPRFGTWATGRMVMMSLPVMGNTREESRLGENLVCESRLPTTSIGERLIPGEMEKVKMTLNSYRLAILKWTLDRTGGTFPFKMRYCLPRIPQSLLQFLPTPLALDLTSKLPPTGRHKISLHSSLLASK